MSSRGLLISVLFVAVGACTSSDPGSIPSGDDFHDTVDAAPERPATEHQECGLPGDEPCGDGTSCHDFGHWGGPMCSVSCQSNDDCVGTDVCDNGLCSPESFGGPGGIYPEATCYWLSSCGYGSESTCLANTDTCVQNLTSDQVHTWVNDVAACFNSASTCGDFYSCWLNTVPWC